MITQFIVMKQRLTKGPFIEKNYVCLTVRFDSHRVPAD